MSGLDIQGHLGDCWFLSAVAVLAEVSRISEVIITPEYNEEGIYTVRFCIQVISYKHNNILFITPSVFFFGYPITSLLFLEEVGGCKKKMEKVKEVVK